MNISLSGLSKQIRSMLNSSALSLNAILGISPHYGFALMRNGNNIDKTEANMSRFTVEYAQYDNLHVSKQYITTPLGFVMG